jgi:hypothetical protein
VFLPVLEWLALLQLLLLREQDRQFFCAVLVVFLVVAEAEQGRHWNASGE